MIGASEAPGLWSTGIVLWRGGQAESTGGECFPWRFKRDDWETEGHAEETADGSAKGVACEPNLGVGIDLCDIAVELNGSAVVAVFLFQGFNQAGSVTGIGR